MKRILIISFSPINRDPRVMRQIRLLEDSYDLIVAGYGQRPDAKVEYVELSLPKRNFLRKALFALKLGFRLFNHYYWNQPGVKEAFLKLSNNHYDLIVANDLSALPIALKLKGTGRVLFDAHEYSPREFEDSWIWRLFFSRYNHYMCKWYLPQVCAMTTVCQGIANEYALQYGVPSKVVYNAPLDQFLSPTEITPGRIRLIHHGGAIRSRHLETMIEVMQHLDERFTLDFMLVNNDAAYMSELRQRAAHDRRISFVDPVPMVDICKAINNYDIGIYLLQPVNFNHKHALPNKIFEFIQARLAVAVGPSPEMASIVNEYSFGLVAPSFEPHIFAKTLSEINEKDLSSYKNAADEAAKKINYQVTGLVFLGEIERLLMAESTRSTL